MILDTVADQEIINPPARVIDFAGFNPLGPPGVGAFYVTVYIAEGVRESFIQKIAEALPLLIGKAGGSAIILRMCQIDFLMCHIEITTGHHRFVLVQLL